MGSSVQVQAIAFVHGGEVIASPIADDTSGPAAQGDMRKIFVRGLIPKEKGLVSITEEHKNFRRGNLLEVKEASPDRISPPCPYFARCGGCNYQYVPIELQRTLKRSMVETTLQRQAKAVPVNGVTLLGQDLPAYQYRRRISLHLSPSAGPKPAEIGFYREGTGEVIDLDSCLIASPLINETLSKLRSLLSEFESSFGGMVIEEHQGDVFIAAKLREDALEHVDHADSPAIAMLAQSFKHCCVLANQRPIFSQYDSLEEPPTQRRFPVGRFSQVNAEGNALLQSQVVSLIQHKQVTDLFAGAGNFAIEIAKSGRLVEAVELDAELVHLGKIASFEAGLSDAQLSFVESSCENYLEVATPRPCVVLDPPRSGADAVVRQLTPSISPQVIYVSCSLPTLCRDVKTLQARGYKLQQTWVVDMFAQTHHVETISVFQAS